MTNKKSEFLILSLLREVKKEDQTPKHQDTIPIAIGVHKILNIMIIKLVSSCLIASGRQIMVQSPDSCRDGVIKIVSEKTQS